MMNLALNLGNLGRHKDAIQLLEETLKLQRAKLGVDDPDTLRTMNNLADSYNKDGRDEDALKLQRQTLALKRAKLGINHPDTLRTMWGQAISLLRLDRAPKRCRSSTTVSRAAGKVLEPGMLLQMIDARLRHFAKSKDGAGCRASAAMWEQFDRRDADSLYNAACWRTITAQVLRDTDATVADAEADRAIAWLRQAVAAGYRDAAHAATDPDLEVLRQRADFQEILGQLQARSSKDPK